MSQQPNLQPLFSMPYNMSHSSAIFSLQTPVLLVLSVSQVFHSQTISRFTGAVIRFIADNQKTLVAFLFITASVVSFFCCLLHVCTCCGFLSCHATCCLQTVQIPQIWWEFMVIQHYITIFPKKILMIIIGSLFA